MVRPGEVASNSSAGSTRALVLATVAFLAAFYVWALFGPLAPTLQKTLGLSDAQLSLLVAIPVLLGSVLRVPMGALTDRYGARLVFPALLLFVTLPLIGLALFHSSFGTLIFFGLLLGFTGSSFAVGVPYVSRWTPRERQGLALGLYGMGMGGTVLTALTAPTLAQTFGVTACFLPDALEMAIWSRRSDDLSSLVHHSDRGIQYLAIRYTERLAEAGAVRSVGSRGDSYDNALAETVNGLYKTELIRRRGPWRSLEQVELATAGIEWWNHRRLHGATDDRPPAEYEDLYYRQRDTNEVA